MTEPTLNGGTRETESWGAVQTRIDICRVCETARVPHLRVPPARKRHPKFEPPVPTEILFVSVAPPAGGDYFWDEERKSDALRYGLFKALRGIGHAITTCEEFWSVHYYLVPGVKCPSEREGGNDHHPSAKARENCSHHLRSEILVVQPERILALGRLAMATVASALGLSAPWTVEAYRTAGPWWWTSPDDGKIIPIAGTYFPGNERHQGFEHIGPDIRELLKLTPRTSTQNPKPAFKALQTKPLAHRQEDFEQIGSDSQGLFELQPETPTHSPTAVSQTPTQKQTWRSRYLPARINLLDLCRFGVLTGFGDPDGFAQVQTPGPVTFWIDRRELAAWIWPSDTVDPRGPKGR